MPTAVPDPTPGALPKSFNLDVRQVMGAGLGLLCLGILIGFKIGHGTEPLVIEKPVFKATPCADCAEKAIQAERSAHPSTPQWAVPGDSSVPGD